MRTLRLLCSLFMILATVACGGGSGESTSTSAPASTGTSSSLKAVPHEKLQEFLPTMQGWKRGTPQGTSDPAENVSRVQADYNQEGGIGTVGVELTDSARNPNVLAILKEDLQATGTTKGVAGEKKVIRVADFPAVQEWRADVTSGFISVLVADRFIVGVTGSNVGDFAVLQKTVQAIDLKKLASLK